MKKPKALTLKTLSKSNVWDLQENDVFRLLATAEKDADLKDNFRRYVDIFRSAFEIETVAVDRPQVIEKYEARGFQVDSVEDGDSMAKWAVKKRPIMRITDLTYENIHHISAAKLIEVLERNFGGGWESLSQSIQDIIQSGFDISTTTLPANRLHKEGGMYERKVADGYEVLEIPKGSWVEAIFAKEKPELDKPHMKFDDEAKENISDENGDDDIEIDDKKRDDFDDEDAFDIDDDALTEESYRTTYDANPDDLNLEAADLSDDDDAY
ncbi:MAG: hypothetical protein K5854_09050 [Prevotella sp.]|nr:hypothetical protein [Prevotella sp.]